MKEKKKHHSYTHFTPLSPILSVTASPCSYEELHTEEERKFIDLSWTKYLESYPDAFNGQKLINLSFG